MWRLRQFCLLSHFHQNAYFESQFIARRRESIKNSQTDFVLEMVALALYKDEDNV